MSITREELGLAIAKAFTNESPSGGWTLEAGHVFNTTYSHDIRKVADKLMPLLDHAFLDGLYTGLRQGYEEDSPYRKFRGA